jgi:hypothetical protein
MGDNGPGKPPTPIDLFVPAGPGSPTLPGSASSRPRYHPLRDMWLGAVYGAHVVDRLGPLGIFAWILTGFVPVLGTLVALRDAQYAWKVRDRWSLLFNLLGLLPFVKGFASVAILARVKRYHHVLHSAHQVAHVAHAAQVVRRGRAVGAAGNRTARSAVTGAAHGAGALASMRHDDTAPLLENRTAWPALVFGLLLLLLLLPTLVGVAIAATIESAGLVRRVPPAYLIALGGVALLVSLASVLFAQHARQVARRLKERGRARPVVSWLAVMCTRMVFLITLGALALLLYGERATILPR